QPNEFQSAVYRYRLPAALASEVLPVVCQTERLVFTDEDDKDRRILKWDDGPAWVLSMKVIFDDEQNAWTLTGQLTRQESDTATDVRDVTLIVPGGFVVRGHAIAKLEDFGAYEWIKLLRAREPIHVPDGEEADFVDRLLDMPATPNLELPEKLRLQEHTPQLAPILTVHAPRGRWRHEKLRAELDFDYEGTIVRSTSRRLVIVQREQGLCLVRNRVAEQEYWKQLETNGFRRLLDRRRGAHDVEITVHGLGSAVRQLMDAGWVVRADGKSIREAGQVQFRVQTSIDWFELHADVDFGGQRVALPELLATLSRGETTIRLGDGSLGVLPEEWLDNYGLLAGLGTAEGDHLRFVNTQAGLVDALLATQDDVNYDDSFLALRDRMRSFSGVEEEIQPVEFHGELRGYQREGLGWLKFLQNFSFGGCLADDMGLGKTVQLLALLQERVKQDERSVNPSLIVVPKSLMFNWEQEAERFTPALRVLQYSGQDRATLRDDFDQYDIILATYGTLRRDILQLKDFQFDYVVLDEAQTIKNAASQVARASRLLKAHHRIALSGTPIENHLGDLWSIFEFLNPAMLGRSSLFRLYATDAQDPQAREMLGKGLRPFILRRTKQQVANDLPEKVEQTIYCDMGKEQRRLYDEMRSHYRDSLLGLVQDQGLAKSQMHVLEALLRLRQAACHPGLLSSGKSQDPSAKLDVLTAHLDEITQEGHKALVFSQFTSLLAIVKEHLDKRGITYEYLDGQTRNRKDHVERFQQDKDCPVFLISLKAGGLGLNLTAAEYVFLLDPWWNPAVEAQAIDRAHRVGQTNRVFAYRLICRDTVEEKIAELQRKKRDLADAILQENNSLIKGMTVEDLDLLLS
ncbi:MAG: DEAD/DEAH box helicase, partial [Planctomycetaceae bacterium]